MAEIESLLFRLFSEFCMQTPGQKQGFLKVSKFYEMAERSRLLDERFTKRSLELLLMPVTKRSNCIGFDTFCSLTTEVAEHKYQREYKKSPANVFMSMINDHFLPLIHELGRSFYIVTQEDLEVPFECC